MASRDTVVPHQQPQELQCRPQFSIAIPAWGSSRYVADALATIGEISDLDLEIVVSVDPGSPDLVETLQAIESSHCHGVRIVQPPKPLSMSEHYEWCLDQLNGEFVTILGADDGVLPWCLELTRKICARYPNADAITFRRAYYFWPGVEVEYGPTRIQISSKNVVKRQSGMKLLSKALAGRVEHFDLPQVYTNNFVRLEVIQKIRAASGGRFYFERNPDVYSGVMVARFAKEIVRCEIPAFWTGTSPSSMGLLQQRAVVRNDAVAQRSVADDFIGKSSLSGHPVAREVGDELWIAAQDSPIYVASAYLRSLDASGAGKVGPGRRSAITWAVLASQRRLMSAGRLARDASDPLWQLTQQRLESTETPWICLSARRLSLSAPRNWSPLRRLKKRAISLLRRFRIDLGPSSAKIRESNPQDYSRLLEANEYIKSYYRDIVPDRIRYK